MPIIKGMSSAFSWHVCHGFSYLPDKLRNSDSFDSFKTVHENNSL